MAFSKLDALDYSPTEVAQLGLLEVRSRSVIYDRIKHGEIRTFLDEYGHKRISAKEIDRLRAEIKAARDIDPDKWDEWQRRRENARAGGLANIAHNGREAVGRQLAAGKLTALEREVDPEGKLPPEERRQRAYDLSKSQLARARAKRAEKRQLYRQYHGQGA